MLRKRIEERQIAVTNDSKDKLSYNEFKPARTFCQVIRNSQDKAEEKEVVKERFLDK